VVQDHRVEQDRGAGQPVEADAPRETPGARADLEMRAERLPAGHPSSPFHDDGSRKPPPPDLTELELPLPDEPGFHDQDSTTRVEPLTSAEYAERVREIQDKLDRALAEGESTEYQYTVDPDHEVWTDSRRALHDEIVNDLYERAENVPNEHEAIMAGGPTGAGKSTVLGNYADIDRSRFLTIDPDDIKKELAQRSMVPKIEGLSPMEASSLVHEESSHIAKLLAQHAYAEGKNVIWDITMSRKSSTEQRIGDMRAAGYTRIEGILVDIPPKVSEARAAARHIVGQRDYDMGKGEGGRFVPPEPIRAQADPTWGSINRKNFEEVKHLFDAWSVYDNSTDGRPPVLIDSSEMRRRLDDKRS